MVGKKFYVLCGEKVSISEMKIQKSTVDFHKIGS